MKEQMKQYEVLRRASLFLEKNGREPKAAELLLQHHLQISRSQFFANMQAVIPESVLEKFCCDLEKHAKTGIPIQHLTGTASFYGRDFYVNGDVLIPRPETEELVEHVIQFARRNEAPETRVTIADIGTGSGSIAITLALELENAVVYAADISEKALHVARKNARQLDADVTFLQGDLLTPIQEREIRPDIIVSNPPYIAWEELPLLADTVRNFDPQLALFADENGLALYKKMIAQLPQVLGKKAAVFFEIGHQQGKAVTSLIKQAFPNSEPSIIKDVNGKERIIVAIMES